MKMENRIVLVYAMLLVFLLLMVKLMTGVIVHEILGVGFVLLTAVHLRVNKSRIKMKGRSVLNILLILTLLTTAISGVMLSVSLFRFLNIQYREIFYTIHTMSAQALLVLSVVHLVLHMKSIAAFFHSKKQDKTEGTQ
ncbi:MAG: DUF4405 domain-containing protein [Clostridiales bacterium]|jgi:hypothetical protein|nr:DUF4405 domain-containing protein [Clostridiales bacterium]